MSGILLAVLAGIGFGIFQTLNRKAGEGLDAIRGTFLLIAVATLVLLLLLVVSGDITSLVTMPIGAILAFSAAGFIHFFMGWTFISISQQQIGAARTGAVIGSMPLFGLVVDLAIYREVFTWQALLGVFLIVGGVIIISLR